MQISPLMKKRLYKHRNWMRRRKVMRQKYVISRDGAKNKLKIREYAIIDKNQKKLMSAMVQTEDFSFEFELGFNGIDPYYLYYFALSFSF